MQTSWFCSRHNATCLWWYIQSCLGARHWVISWSHSCILLHISSIPLPSTSLALHPCRTPHSDLAHCRPRFCSQNKRPRWQQKVALLLPFLLSENCRWGYWIIGSFWIICLSWSYYQAGLPSRQVLRGEYGAVARVGSKLQKMESRPAERSPPGSRLWIMSFLETLKIHSPPALLLQRLHGAGSALSGPAGFDSH